MSEASKLAKWLRERAKGIRRREPYPPLADSERLERAADLIEARPAEAKIAEIRAETIEQCARQFDTLGVLRKMWAASDVAAAIRAIATKGNDDASSS